MRIINYARILLLCNIIHYIIIIRIRKYTLFYIFFFFIRIKKANNIVITLFVHNTYIPTGSHSDFTSRSFYNYTDLRSAPRAIQEPTGMSGYNVNISQ